MLIFHNPLSLTHNPPHEILSGCLQPYFESPERYHRILDTLLVDKDHYEGCELDLQAQEVETKEELNEAISRVHERAYTDFLKEIYDEWTAEGGSKDAVLPETFLRNDLLLGSTLPENVKKSAIARTGQFFFDLSAPITKDTWIAALASAQVALTASRWLDTALAPAVFALCRPPGHHSTESLCGGYCYLNNIAIAVRDYQSTPLRSLKRRRPKVAILDIDYHHGNGTSKIFFNDPSVLYVSLHGSPDYPYYTGSESERGGPSALGTNLNYPLPLGTDNTLYLKTLSEAVKQIDRFEPDRVFVSLGVDTFIDDPLTQFSITREAYPEMGKLIATLQKKTVFVMEGGYCLDAIGGCVKGVLDGFLENSML
ncbi:histone deacetylase family protein [Sporobolomyces salmoneus]|uniref:histone deacetylase family protein n=1 Tax=Sporobolomyces salmoneus TaxID=183962 RepID=UPI00317E9693